MRASRIAAVSELCQDVSSAHMIVKSNFDTSGLQMSKGDIPVGSDANDDVVARDVIKRDQRGQNPRSVLRYSVHDLGDFSIRHSMNRFAIAPPIFVARGSVMRVAIRANLDPI